MFTHKMFMTFWIQSVIANRNPSLVRTQLEFSLIKDFSKIIFLLTLSKSLVWWICAERLNEIWQLIRSSPKGTQFLPHLPTPPHPTPPPVSRILVSFWTIDQWVIHQQREPTFNEDTKTDISETVNSIYVVIHWYTYTYTLMPLWNMHAYMPKHISTMHLYSNI